jgi:hypothetical protein
VEIEKDNKSQSNLQGEVEEGAMKTTIIKHTKHHLKRRDEGKQRKAQDRKSERKSVDRLSSN